MSQVIRVDEEVFKALQNLATPFVDSPNDVLRRLMNLDEKEEKMRPRNQRNRTDSGRRINERYGLGAKHALYHVDGTFYERLERFPGLLCDKSGYVRYETEEEFLNDPHLDIQEKVNVAGTLSKHRRHCPFPIQRAQPKSTT